MGDFCLVLCAQSILIAFCYFANIEWYYGHLLTEPKEQVFILKLRWEGKNTKSIAAKIVSN